jgi:GT2 family glycosyltransferase
MIGGQTLNELQKNLFSIASQQLISYFYVYYNSDSKKNRFFTSNNIAVSAEGFRAVGGFDTTFPLAAGEDRELCNRWLHHGYQMSYTPKAIVYHAHALSLGEFLRQHFNYGRGAFRFHQICLSRSRGRASLEPLSFYLNLLRFPFSLCCDTRTLLVSLLFLCSQITNALGYFWEKINGRTDISRKDAET